MAKRLRKHGFKKTEAFLTMKLKRGSLRSIPFFGHPAGLGNGRDVLFGGHTRGDNVQDADRKLTGAAVIVMAAIAAELAWIIATGYPSHNHDAYANAAQETAPTKNHGGGSFLPRFGVRSSPRYPDLVQSSAFGGETRRLAEGADDQVDKMVESIAAMNAVASETRKRVVEN